MPRHIRHFGFIALAATIALSGVGALAGAAGADPIADKQAQAKALQDAIDANGQKIAALGEQYDGAQLKLQQAEQAIADAKARIAATQRRVTKIKALVDERAASVYRHTLVGSSLDDFDVSDVSQFATRQKYAAAQAGRDNSLLAQLAAAKQQLAEQKTAAEHARADADAQRQQIDSARQQLQAANGQQQQLLSQVQGQLAVLVAQEQARRQAAALASARTRFGVRTNGNAAADPNLPAPGPAAAQAIAFAKAQLGKPYQYAAAGPDAYDCSGLVMAAYASAGVSLPHYSGAQYAMLPHVPLNAMEPGDLIFWGPGGSEHVAIYLGNGELIEAGGGDVHIGPIWGSPVGAARVS